MKCKHENTELIYLDYKKKECVVECKDCGRTLKLTGCIIESINYVPDTIPEPNIPGAYQRSKERSNEDFDGGYVDFDGDIAP